MPEANPLDQLRDIHLPATIDWWPLAYGWWIVIAIVCIATAALIYAWLRYRRANRYRHAAIAELNALFSQESETATLMAQTSALLKRAAITKFGEQCGQLHGQQWLDFLSLHCPLKNHQALSTLCLQQYEKQPTIDLAALQQQASQWLKGHK